MLSLSQEESQVARLFTRLAYLKLKKIHVCVYSVIPFCFLLMTEIIPIFFVSDEVLTGILNTTSCSPAHLQCGSLLTRNVC